MKKYLLLSAVACTLAGCSNDFNPADVVIDQNTNTDIKEAPIGFSASNSNMLRAASLEQSHYNFGVFAHKNGGNGAETTIMKDYLVGFSDGTNGYKFSTTNQTTWEGSNSSLDDNKSQWSYENLGTDDYTNDTDGFYKTSDIEYMSNHQHQYLRYWDHSSTSTNFYAYAPYYNHGGNTGVTYNHNTHTLTIPDGAIKAGNDDTKQFEAMYAAAYVEKENYNKDVQLGFKRLSCKIKIAFYEDIAGYSVQMKPLLDGTVDISAAPATVNGTTHSSANVLKEAGATIEFNNTNNFTTVNSIVISGISHYSNTEYLSFKVPTGIAAAETTTGENGETAILPQHSISEKTPIAPTDYSPTTYYGIPKKEASDKIGFTFHVSYQLTSTTGETILVKNATVHVPGENCQWESNKQYTYIFKITKGSTGTTGEPGTIDPASPTLSEKALYPIVFDGCTVQDWEDGATTEHDIN